MRTIEMNGKMVAELEDRDDMLAMVDNVAREFREWEYIEVKDADWKVIYTETNPDV